MKFKEGDKVKRIPGSNAWVEDYLPQIGKIISIDLTHKRVNVQWYRKNGKKDFASVYPISQIQLVSSVNTLGNFPKKGSG